MIGLQPVAKGTAAYESSPVPASLHAARDRFKGLILTRLLAFESLRAALSVSANGRPELVEIGALCHKIAGAGATLGFVRAGEVAGRLDGAIDEGLAAHAAPRDIWQRIDPLLETLMADLESALGP